MGITLMKLWWFTLEIKDSGKSSVLVLHVLMITFWKHFHDYSLGGVMRPTSMLRVISDLHSLRQMNESTTVDSFHNLLVCPKRYSLSWALVSFQPLIIELRLNSVMLSCKLLVNSQEKLDIHLNCQFGCTSAQNINTSLVTVCNM